MTTLKLREYQEEAINSVFDAWAEGMRRPAVVLPTGAGKTVVFSHLIKSWRMSQTGLFYHDKTPQTGRRVMVLVHRDELADQAIAKIRSVAPDLSVGKVKADDRDVHTDVMVCSVQTLAHLNRRLDVLKAEVTYGSIGLIITDECHHAAAPSYKRIYAAWPAALHVGFTATMARGDGVGLGSVWEDVVYRKSPLWMISKGHLVDVKAQTISADFDLSAIKKSGGDYQAGELGRMMEETHADEAIARAYVEHAKDRPGVVFTPTVETAEAAAKSLNEAGIGTAVITGGTPREERQQIFRDYREGRVQVLANCMVLTEGFDAPWASCAVIARPTQSEPLYQQMVGRVLRTWPGKQDALVLHLMGSGGTLRTLVDLDPTSHVTQVKDGETLAEAEVRETESIAGGAQPGTVSFDLKIKEHDLFKGSAYAWSKTKAGVLFIGCGETTVFLWPTKEGRFSVCTVNGRGGKWAQTKYADLDLSSAMAWGEALSEDFAMFGVQRSASWRRKPASEKQRNFLRIAEDVKLTQGEASDMIGARIESQRFDKFVGKLYL